MTAILSPCGTFRYTLERDVQTLWLPRAPVFAYFGINPSTADASNDDSTVRKWTGFTRAFGGKSFMVGNAFALRSKNVRDLRAANDPIGPENDTYLHRIARAADVLVPCWGAREKLPKALRPRLDEVLAKLRASGKPVMCFGTTGGGDPLHPLFLPYSTELQPL